MSDKEEKVYLSPLKFAKPPTSTNGTSAQPNPNQTQPNFNTASPGFGRSKLYEILTTETMSDDLTPSAAIWEQYQEEAREHDDELVKGRNGNLDQMLLFAALFSAVLSAFLLESKSLLQQDSADVSVALLLSIAQSQQRIEQGTPQLASPPIELPSFSPPLSARWINGLWFFALALSLSAALIAMLAKEWLMAFTASRPRTSHAYTLLHQERLVGLTEWRALHMIDLLPSILHLALLLFSLGLVLYLWTLDSGIAIAVVVVSGATMVFYVATAFAAAIHESCPFVTQISKYIQSVLKAYANEWMKGRGRANMQDDSSSGCTTYEEHRALAWLAKKARDTDVVDYVYMCLTGLRPPVSKPTAQNGDDEVVVSSLPAVSTALRARLKSTVRIGSDVKHRYSHHGQQKPLRDLFGGLCKHLSQARVQQSRELATYQGLSVARYACALPYMVERLQISHTYQATSDSIGGEVDKQISGHPAQTAFAALDTIWSEEYPALSPDSYALLTSAELRLTVVAVSVYTDSVYSPRTAPDVATTSTQPPTRTSPQKDIGSTESFVEITVDSVNDAAPKPPVSLLALRARYSRALTRAGFLLFWHTRSIAPISVAVLVHLLDSIRTGAQCTLLNPESHLSTHQPQSESGQSPVFWARPPGPWEDYVRPRDVGAYKGLLVGLLGVVGSAEAQTPPALERAAVGALGTIAPILLKQWLKATLPHGEREESEHGELSEGSFSDWPMAGDSYGAEAVKIVLTWQVMHIAIFAVSHARCPGINDLPKQAVLALFKRCQVAPSHSGELIYGNPRCGIDHLICTVDSNSARLNGEVFKSLIDILLLIHEGHTIFNYEGIAGKSVVSLLRVLRKTPVQAYDPQLLLDVLVHDVQNYSWYLDVFTESEEGFSTLMKIGEHDESRSIVAKSVVQIIKSVAARSTDTAVVAQAVVGLFAALAFALKALSSDKDETLDLLASARQIVSSLYRRPSDTLHAIATSKSAARLCHTLRNTVERSETQADLLVMLEELLSWSYAYDLPMEGLRPFFEKVLGVSLNRKTLTGYTLMPVIKTDNHS